MDLLEFENIRKSLGWTKKETAKRLGIHERTVHGYLRGESPIPIPICKLIKIYSFGGIFIEKEE